DLVAKKYKVGDQPVAILTFDDLTGKTPFIKDIRRLLKTLEKHYEYPVDVEYTVNFTSSGKMQVNLVQCRPLQAKGEGRHVEFPKEADEERLIFSSSGNFMGGNVSQPIGRIIYIDPKAYGGLLFQKKFEIARLIGRLNRGISRAKLPVMLIGPGRWGTRDATLGVPVSFAEISSFAALAEVSDPAAGFNPDLSFGSHFFLDLVEANIFYIALFAGKKEVFFNREWLERQRNILTELRPEEAGSAPVVRIYDCDLRLFSDITTQKVILTKM
ncbi:MAG: PEP/pyruvate-binding domain-containing protein, partial [Candidatus Margulisbacteria bacterium]|nr:PEP/pyruvate-binding domain-containing protein [Candidatus Margulisiibacteriota bacterium]